LASLSKNRVKNRIRSVVRFIFGFLPKCQWQHKKHLSFNPIHRKKPRTELWYITIRYTISTESQRFTHLHCVLKSFSLAKKSHHRLKCTHLRSKKYTSRKIPKYLYLQTFTCSQTNIVTMASWLSCRFRLSCRFWLSFRFWLNQFDYQKLRKPPFFSVKSFTKFFLVFFLFWILPCSFNPLHKKYRQKRIIYLLTSRNTRTTKKQWWKKWFTKKRCGKTRYENIIFNYTQCFLKKYNKVTTMCTTVSTTIRTIMCTIVQKWVQQWVHGVREKRVQQQYVYTKNVYKNVYKLYV